MQLVRISLAFERGLDDARHVAERRGDAFITLSHVLLQSVATDQSCASLTAPVGHGRTYQSQLA